MKKILLYLFIFMSILKIDAMARGFDHNLIFDDLNTINFQEKLKDIDLNRISKICSYDFCDYLKGNNIEDSLEIFTKKYIKNIQDEEIKNTLNVKGVKITKITLKN